MIRHIRTGWPVWVVACLILTAAWLGTFPRTLAGLKPHEWLLLIIALAFVTRRVIQRNTALPITVLDAGFWLLIAGGTVVPLATMEVRGIFITAGALRSLLAPIEYYLWYRVVVEAFPVPAMVPRLWSIILIAITGISGIAIAQAVHIPGISALLTVISATHQTTISGTFQRATSLVGDWGVLASLAGVALLLLNQIQTDDEGTAVFGTAWPCWLTIMTIINAAAIVAALAFEGILALGIGYAIAWRLNGRLASSTVLTLLAGAGTTLILAPLVAHRILLQSTGGSLIPATWQVRWLHWQIVWQAIGANWSTFLLGVQPDFRYPVSSFNGTESLYWLLWYRGGVFYVVTWLIWLGMILHGASLYAQARGIFIVILMVSAIGVIDALWVDAGEVQIIMTMIAVIGSWETTTRSLGCRPRQAMCGGAPGR